MYLEQMMYATYCSALRDDKSISETDKANRIKAYNLEVRRTLQGTPPKPPPKEGGERRGSLTPLEARNELAKLSLPYSPEGFVRRAEEGDILAVKLYLAAGMNPDVDVDLGRWPFATALTCAAMNGDVTMANLLLDAKADVNKKIAWGATPIEWAAAGGKLEIMRLFLDKGASVENSTSAFVAAARGGQTEAMRLLLKRHASTKNAGAEALAAAAGSRAGVEKDKIATVNFLLDLGVDVNSRDKEGKTILHKASHTGYHSGVVKTLLDRGAELNARDNSGATALWWAAGIGLRESARMLVDKGADVNVRANDGSTALSRAKYNNDKEMIEFLLNHGAE